jgi:hypothetical protein
MDGEKTDLLLTINWLILNYSMDMKSVCIFFQHNNNISLQEVNNICTFFTRDVSWEGSTSFGKIRAMARLFSYMW